ncbi:ABC transporter ATP-binding protein [Rhizobium laguerreae]|nr:ABC transporter ATP-binding protein [Rhizobium laguerreae]
MSPETPRPTAATAASLHGKHIVNMRGVTKRFGKFTALHDIDLDITKGEILTLLGPSGCGKTTLMRLIAGFDDVTEGELLLNGKDVKPIAPEKRPVNMVFQRYALFPHLDVFDNVAFGPRLKKVPEAEVRTKVNAMLKLVQLDTMASRWITELSGGQCQRVALARALVNSPEVLLLDEPLAALDLKIRHHMLAELKRIHNETGTTFLYVTHDQDEAMILSDRIALLNGGRIEQIGTPDEMYAHPKTLFAAKFLGETNILPVTLQSVAQERTHLLSGTIAIIAPSGVASGTKDVKVSIRPENIEITANDRAAPEPNSCVGVVTDVTFIGSRIQYVVEVPGNETFRVQAGRPVDGAPFQPGAEVKLSWPWKAMVIVAE